MDFLSLVKERKSSILENISGVKDHSSEEFKALTNSYLFISFLDKNIESDAIENFEIEEESDDKDEIEAFHDVIINNAVEQITPYYQKEVKSEDTRKAMDDMIFTISEYKFSEMCSKHLTGLLEEKYSDGIGEDEDIDTISEEFIMERENTFKSNGIEHYPQYLSLFENILEQNGSSYEDYLNSSNRTPSLISPYLD